MSVEEIMEEVRRRAAAERKAHPELQEELEKLREARRSMTTDPTVELDTNLHRANLLYNPTLLPPRTRFRLAKRILLSAARLHMRGQVEYNAAIVRVLNVLRQWTDQSASETAQLKKRLENTEKAHLQLKERLDQVEREHVELVNLIQNLKE